MKKLYLMCAMAMLGVGVTGCGSNGSSNSSSEKTEATSSSAKASTNNLKIAKNLEKQFNTDGNKSVSVKVEPEVVDDHFENNKSHQDIIVTAEVQDVIDRLKSDKEVIDNGTANNDQKMYIASIQEIIHDEASNLKSNTGAISFGYEMDEQNFMTIAESGKNKDFVKPVEIDIE